MNPDRVYAHWRKIRRPYKGRLHEVTNADWLHLARVHKARVRDVKDAVLERRGREPVGDSKAAWAGLKDPPC